MKSFLSVALVIVHLSVVPCAFAQMLSTPAPRDSLTVTTVGQAEARPDWAEVSLSLEGRGASASEALVKHQAARDRSIAQLVRHGVSRADITWTAPRLGGLGIMGMGDPNQQTQRFTASSTLKVRLREVDPDTVYDQVAEIIDVAATGVDAGPQTPRAISDMMSAGDMVVFGVNDPRSLRDQAVANAIQSARELAELAVGPSGRKVGPITGLQLMDPAGGQGMMAVLQFLSPTAQSGKATCAVFAAVTFALE